MTNNPDASSHNFPVERNFLSRQHRFYVPELLTGLSNPRDMPQDERGIIAHYYMGMNTNASAGKVHWFINHYDAETNISYGFACLGEPLDAEFGDIPMDWLEDWTVSQDVYIHGEPTAVKMIVRRDLDWTPTMFGELRQLPEYDWVNKSLAVSPQKY